MPGRTTGGNGLAAAASLAFIIRRYFPASYRMPANCVKARTTARSRRPAGGVGSCGVDVRPPSDWGISNKKPATDFSVRALQFSR